MLVVLLILAVALILVGVVLAARKGAAGANSRIEEAVAELDVRRRDKANFYGMASNGSTSGRALGTLVLTPDELVFLQMVPADEIRVPRSDVIFAEIARSFLGKSLDRDLLLVTWRTEGEEGAEPGQDRGAWEVADTDGWRADLWPG
jgi:hypothetical protein